MKKIKALTLLLVGIFIISLLGTFPAYAQIIEQGTDNGTYYQTTVTTEEWRLEYEAAFTPGYGHRQYEVLYQNGLRTTTTRYTGGYIILAGESVNSTVVQNPVQTTTVTTIEWRVSYDSYFTPNKGHKMFLVKWVNGVQTSEINYTDNYIVLSNETLPNGNTSNWDPYGPYNPYSPNSNCSNNNTNQNWDNADVYLNNNTPKTTGLSGCDAYYLNTGNRKVKIHVTVPYGWSLIVGGTQVESKSGGVYDYWPNQGEYTKTVKNGFAIIVPKASLYSEFKARVQLARDSGWDNRYVTWPSQY